MGDNYESFTRVYRLGNFKKKAAEYFEMLRNIQFISFHTQRK